MNERPLIDLGRQKILSLAAETQFASNGIVSRTLLRTPNSRMVLFGFAEGQELTEHTSTQHAVIQILSGECEFSLAGQPHALKAGDLLYLPPNLPHAVKAMKPFSMLLTLSQPEIQAVTAVFPKSISGQRPVAATPARGNVKISASALAD
jgi:quercetin dioxygenase-like cupin family protein